MGEGSLTTVRLPRSLTWPTRFSLRSEQNSPT